MIIWVKDGKGLMPKHALQSKMVRDAGLLGTRQRFTGSECE